jgi:hypothetical protein
MIGVGGILYLNILKPGVFSGRLIKMTMDTDIIH